MSRLSVVSTDKVNSTTEKLMKEFTQRIVANPPGVCPVDMQLAFLKVCHAQTCGKCVPCRVGLGKLEELLEDVLDNKATMRTLDLIEKTAENIKNSADCAIGFESARMVLAGLEGFREDYISHVKEHKCIGTFEQPIPCVTLCPANVDIPGYIALAGEGRCADAVKLIRKDNPFPTACALICEHPCEARCRRNMIDDSINIRGMKRYIVDNAPTNTVPVPECAPSTGKKVAIIGGGPSGLTAAYFLQLMGHQTTVFEEKAKLGGMLRYGIPNYRFPRERLQEDIDAILSTGVEVKLNTVVDTEAMEKIRNEYDAVYIAIGAHTDKKLGLEGENSNNVISAVDMLREIGDDKYPDFTGKRVIVVGGGNVAMDCARTAMRANAKTVSIVYRRRQEDMTALPEEVEGAIAEGIELVTLKAPLRVEADENGNACALWVQPQIIGPVKAGRPAPRKANKPEERMECDVILVAIGQDIVSKPFEDFGIAANRGRLCADETGALNMVGIFAGGDCVSGPATVIKAIGAGKVAAANIDEFLGYHHPITVDVEIPEPLLNDKIPCGRVNLSEKEAWARKRNFEGMEYSMSDEEAVQEASRCLRCDRHGCGVLRGGRQDRW
ncbi:MAG TPA: FAD-dependent oxidoreductase [Candidatus Eubacterium avistercoris]|uniref:FAD-dependent oxidoreductase n=1 Tax=Candidatus Eubacterium avistercoris TaxID=2838567 RepID=A0A9D2IEU9_9FIRM|nr:FAD-dependent oxidoreductase [Candidatus Eubacterium avistercoris]